MATLFIKAFKPDDPAHVKWLSDMIDMAENIKPNMIEMINKNPMNISIEQKDILDWPHVHFCLCGLYTKAIFRKTAFIL